jgi:predicted RND superfamily exporter protein
MKLVLTRFGIRFPWLMMLLVLAATVWMTRQFPSVSFDNNPENMLAYDEPVRQIHREVKDRFDLYDFVVVGVVNTSHKGGAWNPETLGRIHRLTEQLLSLTQTGEGEITVRVDGREYTPDLRPKGWWPTLLAKAFQQDAQRLFTEEGEPGLIGGEIIAPSVVDTLRQLDQGELDIRFLMEEPPATQAEADALFEEAWANPLYRDTLLSGDRVAIGVYLPILEKEFSHNLARLVEYLTADWPEEDAVYITGLPVAEDTFGQEMLVQMATSAPLAGLMIFLLLLFFFRRVSLIIAPMLIAVVSVICTMGLLIGMGFDVHIMSSMIAIFLMPIAVADSVHILSEFFDSYAKFGDKRKTLEHVMGHLFSPMLFTSLTTIAGFASLALTPIPPVRVFGMFVAFGVGLAWLLSVTLIPAYIMLAVPQRTLDRFEPHVEGEASNCGWMSRILGWVGSFSMCHHKLILALLVVVSVLAGVGISRIQVNDNPVLWFVNSHRIRVADRVLNNHFGGTYTAYLELVGPEQQTVETSKIVKIAAAGEDWAELKSAADQGKDFDEVLALAVERDGIRFAARDKLMDTVLYEEPANMTWPHLQSLLEGQPEDLRETLLQEQDALSSMSGGALQDQVLLLLEEAGGLRWADALRLTRANLEAPTFKNPEVLRWMEALQDHLADGDRVGKSTSAVDALKKAHYELRRVGDDPDQMRYFSVPDSASAAGQVFLQLEGMKKQDSLFHLVTRDYQQANIWLQLTSGDNRNMLAAKEEIETWIRENPPPRALRFEWAGLTYLNVVWQARMVGGMLRALAGSFVVVLLMMVMLFRSLKFGLLSMVPLTLTIGFTYGIIGWVGKAYDMPVAVLSSLTLGLSVDFAIHFLQRARELVKEHGSWAAASPRMFREPARAISRNAIVIAVGFTPLLLAPLVPYKTVGFFLATIMFLSWLATLFILSALISLMPRYLFSKDMTGPSDSTDRSEPTRTPENEHEN